MRYIILYFFHSAIAFGASRDCFFGKGHAKITYVAKTADVRVSLHNVGPTYRNCTVSHDEFGELIDCSTGNRDFMLVISKDNRKVGGVMSSTLNLFDDISC